MFKPGQPKGTALEELEEEETPEQKSEEFVSELETLSNILIKLQIGLENPDLDSEVKERLREEIVETMPRYEELAAARKEKLQKRYGVLTKELTDVTIELTMINQILEWNEEETIRPKKEFAEKQKRSAWK